MEEGTEYRGHHSHTTRDVTPEICNRELFSFLIYIDSPEEEDGASD